MRRSASRYYEELSFPAPTQQQARFLALADKFLSLPDVDTSARHEKITQAEILSFPKRRRKRPSKLRAA
jgi:hypothetical protein